MKKSTKIRNINLKAVITWCCAILCGITAMVQYGGSTAEASDSVEATSFYEEEHKTEESGNGATLYELPENTDYTGKKCYISYTAITDKTSLQYELQTAACTDLDAFRLLDNRYLVSVGTYFNAPCGTYIDLILENGTEIPCIVGEIKPDKLTSKRVYSANGCASAFIVDANETRANLWGDVSYLCDEWQSKVSSVRVYNKNYFDTL